MQRLQTAITWTLTVLLVTSAAAGAVSNGPVADAVESVAGDEHSTRTEAAAPNGTNATVSGAQVEAALGPFLDELDVTARQRRAILAQAARMRENGASPARIVDASFHTLRNEGVPGEEIRESAWRLRVGLLLAQLDLTDAQRAEIVDVVEAKRADNADAPEIRRAAGAKLLDYGVERSEVRRAWRNVRHVELHLRMHRLEHEHRRFHASDRGQDHPDGKPAWAHRVQHRYDLTDDEIDAIVAEARGMRADGADRGDVLEMIHRKLHEFDADHRHGERFRPHDRPSDDATDEGSDARSDDGNARRDDGDARSGDGDARRDDGDARSDDGDAHGDARTDTPTATPDE